MTQPSSVTRAFSRLLPARASVLACALVLATVARAQGPVLHERVPDVRENEAIVLSSPGSGAPAAIVYDGEVITAPADGALQPDERPMVATPGSEVGEGEPGRRSPTFRPDRITELESTVGYFTVFAPSIAPFKRVSALDQVVMDGRVPVLGVADARLREVRIASPNVATPDSRVRDRFWGSVVLDFTSGPVVPLPSVSPESRILFARTEPSIAVRIERDGADNFFARATGPSPPGQVRLTYLTDAPRDYFNAETIPDVASDGLASRARSLPPELERSALRFAEEDLGLVRGAPLPRVLGKLTEYFRSFTEADEPPENTGNIYLDLARGKRGVCRHRAYAFVITSLALGVPARFVMNEAHAWVEVEMPSVGWMRIDLGGSAAGLDAHNAEDRPTYRPVYPDPLPRPEPYTATIEALQRRQPPEAETMEGAGGGAGSGNGATGEEEGAGGRAGSSRSRIAAEGERTADGASDRVAARPDPSTRAPDSDGPRRPVRLVIERRTFDVYRGRSLELSGRALSEVGDGVAGLRVEIVAVHEEEERLLGVTVTREHGSFRGTLGIPHDLEVGEYRLVVRTPGDAQFRAAIAP